MKKITLTQYVQVRRTVILEVEDGCGERDTASALSQMQNGFFYSAPMPSNAKIVSDWSADMSAKEIRNAAGEVVLSYE